MESIKNILEKLSIEEKVSLFTGKNFWYLKSIPKFNIPSILLSDGPHGLRKEIGNGDTTNINASIKATCFPLACLSSCSFDPLLLQKLGEALGDECRSEFVSLLLGPGVNHKRSPLGGRNFEYFSEDPLLSGLLASGFIKGVQSKGVGCCIKHFACNNQEKARLVNDSIVDERALREIYLKPFEIAIKKSNPYAVMASYNLVNGEYATESKKLLLDILREEWGYDGCVVTDWGAINDPVKAIKNGCNIEMPGVDNYLQEEVLKAYKKNQISKAEIDSCAEKVLKLIQRSQNGLNKPYNKTLTNLDISYEVASKSIVLLKNENDILPLKTKNIKLVGDFAKNTRYQGSGSSLINPTSTDSIYEQLSKDFNVTYFQGYEEKENPSLIDEVTTSIKESDTVICVVGLYKETEGLDRVNLSLPKHQNELVNAISKVSKNVIVILQTGGVVELPWVNRIQGLVLTYLGGSRVCTALKDILRGVVNPSGKLSETWVKTLDSCFNYNNDIYKTLYKESIFTGYRYYDTLKINVLYPFGYGLSYSTFNFSSLQLSRRTLSVIIENTSNVDGSEVIQVYIGKKDSVIPRPLKELKAFHKIELTKKTKAVVHFELDDSCFEFYNTNSNSWEIEDGVYQIYVGSSIKDIHLTTEIIVNNPNKINYPTYPSIYYTLDKLNQVTDTDFENLIGRKIEKEVSKQFTLNTPLIELNRTRKGKKIYTLIKNRALKELKDDHQEMALNVLDYLPIRGLRASGQVNIKMCKGIVYLANGKIFKGLRFLK